MKNIIFILAFICSCSTVCAYQFSENFSDSIKENEKISCSVNPKECSRKLDKNYIFTKHMTIGTGGFSEYTCNNKRYDTNTTFEFLYQKRLIGYNHHNLKFTYLDFDGTKFNQKELTTEELKTFFPDVEFLKISEFKNNKITVYKPLFATKHYLLINDTQNDYYKYFFEKYNNEKTLFRALFTARLPKMFVYSHFGNRDNITPPLYIEVKTKSLF